MTITVDRQTAALEILESERQYLDRLQGWAETELSSRLHDEIRRTSEAIIDLTAVA